MAKTFAFSAAVWTLLLVWAGAVPAQQPGNPPPVSAPPLKIDSGDLIEIGMFDNPELSGRFRVNENGDITFPLLGPVHVKGETAEEAGTTIEKRFIEADILKPANAHAVVFISEFASQAIAVGGEVRTPGLYPALGVRMLSDVMIAAGGVLPSASSELVLTRKSDPEHPLSIEYNPEALTPVVPRLQIFPGDSIMVPRAGLVYVIGNVNRPGAFVLEGRSPLTVEKAMGLASGGGHGAALNRAHLVRIGEGGKKVDMLLSVNSICKGKAPDVDMKDGDILFIPTSTARLATQQAITSALGIGTSVAIYKTAYQ